MIKSETVADLLDRAAMEYPAMTFHAAGPGPGAGQKRTAAELSVEAQRVAARLVERGVRPGELVGVLLPNSLELYAVYFGVLRAGAVLTPLAVPAGARNIQGALSRLRQIALAGGFTRLVTDESFAGLAEAAGLELEVLTPRMLMAGEPNPPALTVGPDDLAVVQYTSGSTMHPKGVALTHAQVRAGVRATILAGKMTSADVYCVWLPLSHDMGLMSSLAHLMVGADIHFSSPSAFIKAPGEWLAYFARVRATISAGPNFSFQYLCDDVDDAALAGLDLSSWRLALNGAEMIDPRLMRRFSERFARAGFRAECMYPVYGLAEATVAVTFPTPGEPPHIDWIDRAALSRGEVVEAAEDAPGARGIVGVGRAVPGLEVRIADAVGPRTLGEIEVRGASVMRGYHLAPEETVAAFRDGWLRTGDLGYLVGDELFVTGRIKELIKLHGESYFPDDVEALVQGLPGVYRHRCVSFGMMREAGEGIAVVIETELATPAERLRLAGEVRRAVAAVLQVSELEVHFVEPRAIPRTTSGKYQRLLLRERIATGETTLLSVG